MQIGRYQVTGVLGRGGSGEVHSGRSPEGRAVAIKVLHAATGETLARFEREARLLATLGEAEGFVPLLEAGRSPRGPFLVMPLLAGGTLRDRLARGPLPVEAVRALGVALARALGRAHALGVVHRDLKPENVLFPDRGSGAADLRRPLVADLGLAKHFRRDLPGASQSASVSQAGGFRGTVGYMAPEQIQDASAAGPAADVFALGSVLYEALTGSRPFEADTALEALALLVEGRFAPVASRRPDVPQELAAVVERALSPEPRDRPADGSELARALEGEASSLAPNPAAGSRRALALGGTVFAAVFLVAGGGLWGLGLLGRRGPAPLPSSSPRVTRSPVSERTPAPLPTGEVDPATWIARGRDLLRHDDALGARDAFDHAVSLDPRSASALAHRALSKIRASGGAAATTDADRALALAPADPLAVAVFAFAHALAGGDLTTGLAQLQYALDKAPADPYVLSLHAALLFKVGNTAGMLEDARKVVEVAPLDASGWRLLGTALFASGDLRGADAAFTRVLELVPDNFTALLNRASVRSGLHDDLAAIADAQRALTLRPDDLSTLRVLGQAQYEVGWYAKAEATVGRILTLAPEDPDALGFRASVFAGHNEMARALEDAEHAIARGCRAPTAYLVRGSCRLSAGDLVGAREDADAALRLQPGLDGGLLLSSRIHVARGELVVALDEVDRSLAARALQPALELRAQVLARLGRAREAALAWDKAIATTPVPVAWRHVGRARARRAANDLAGALADIDLAIALEPLVAEHFADRAQWSLDGPGGVEATSARASADATRAIELDPWLVIAWTTRAYARMRVRDFPAAVADAAHAVELSPGDADSLTTLAQVFDASGDKQRALAVYEAVLAVDPKSYIAKLSIERLKAGGVEPSK